MKYKVLLTGKNNVAIDEFFTKMHNSFECQTTSKRYEDMISHLHCLLYTSYDTYYMIRYPCKQESASLYHLFFNAFRCFAMHVIVLKPDAELFASTVLLRAFVRHGSQLSGIHILFIFLLISLNNMHTFSSLFLHIIHLY